MIELKKMTKEEVLEITNYIKKGNVITFLEDPIVKKIETFELKPGVLYKAKRIPKATSKLFVFGKYEEFLLYQTRQLKGPENLSEMFYDKFVLNLEKSDHDDEIDLKYKEILKEKAKNSFLEYTLKVLNKNSYPKYFYLETFSNNNFKVKISGFKLIEAQFKSKSK